MKKLFRIADWPLRGKMTALLVAASLVQEIREQHQQRIRDLGETDVTSR